MTKRQAIDKKEILHWLTEAITSSDTPFKEDYDNLQSFMNDAYQWLEESKNNP